MATFDSTVRLRQLNKPELSGYIVEVIGDIPNTGELVNSFYPLNSNPNSYVTSGQTGIFTTRTDLDSNYLSTLIYIDNKYYPLSNPSGYVSTLNSSILYTTGFQEIDSFKLFKIRPTVNTTGVLLIGEISGQNLGGDASGLYYETENNTLKFKSLRAGSGIEISVDENSLRFSVTGIVGSSTDLSKSNVVYLTGDQTISGNKFFKSGLSTSNLTSNSSTLSLSGNSGARIEFYDYSYITGFSGISARRIYEDGIRVATAADLEGILGFDIQNVVYKTGNQEINGQKVFSDLIVNGNCEITDNEYSINIDNDYPLIFFNGGGFFSDSSAFYSGPGEYSFSIRGVKNVSNQKVFSKPTTTGFIVGNTGPYCFALSFFGNNEFYDQYFIAVNKDPKYNPPINNSIEYPKIGFFLEETIFSFTIGKTGIGKVTDDLGDNFNPPIEYTYISSEDKYILKDVSKISFESGILVLKSKTVPLVNGTGFLLSGDPNIVYTNGSQTILGKKSFSNYIQAPILKTNWIINDDSIQNLGFFSNFIGSSAGVVNNYTTVNNAYCNFIGQSAGASTSSDNSFSNFIGYWAGYGVGSSFNSNFIGNSAGKYAYGADYSNFIGYEAGSSETSNYIFDNLKSNFIGYRAGYNSNSSQNSIFIGSDAGTSSFKISNSILIGKQAGSGNVFNNPEENSFSILIGNHTSGKLNSIAIGQGAANNLERQLNIGNIIYATGLNTGIISSSNPMLGGKVGILMSNPQYTLDVSGTCRITGETIFGVRPTVNGIGVLLQGEGSPGSSIENIVYTTGDQIISGNKTFNNIYITGSGFLYKNYFPKIEITSFQALPNVGTFYNENASYQFTVYGVKTFEGKKYFSDPTVSNVLTVTNPNPPTYCLKLNWFKNNFYDEYFLAVNKDPKFSTPINDSIENTNWGVYLNKDVDLPIGIGETTGPGHVRDVSSKDFGLYQNLPQDYKNKYYSQIYGTTGNLILKSAFLQLSGQTSFDQRPKVNGTGVLLNGEVSGFNLSNGSGIYFNNNNNTLNFKSLKGGSGIRISGDNNVLIFEVTGIGGVSTPEIKDVVYATGDQVISGEKKFLEKIKIGSGSFRGIFDIEKAVKDIELPPIENATLTFPTNQAFSYKIENSNFSFNIYGYKQVENQKIYSLPVNVDGESPSNLAPIIFYKLQLSWAPNSIYDGYYIQVINDPELSILNGSPFSGILITDKNTSTIDIGETSFFGPGYVSQISSYYKNIRQIGYPDIFYKKLSPQLFLQTGFNNKILLDSDLILISGQTIFDIRPTVNGSGVLLNGEDVGNNVNIENVVYTTGTQTVVGKKTFSNVLSANVLKTNWIISEDNVQYGQPGSLSNFIGERAGVQDNSSIINNVNFIGYEAGFDIRGLNINSNLIGNSAGLSSNNIESSNFIGYQAGLSTIDSHESNFIGYQAGSSSSQNIRSNFIGYLAGGGGESSLNYDSNYIGNQAGYYSSLCQNSNFIGYEAGAYAVGCSFSNFLGNGAGAGSVGSTSSVFIGSFAGNSTFNCFNSIFIGKSAGYQNIYTLPPYDSFSLLIGNYTSGKLNSIAIGQGAANSTEKQLNLANVIYATNINTGTIPSSIPVSNGKVGILIHNPQYTLDVSGTCRISGKAIFGERPEVNGSGVLLQGEDGGSAFDVYQIRYYT